MFSKVGLVLNPLGPSLGRTAHLIDVLLPVDCEVALADQLLVVNIIMWLLYPSKCKQIVPSPSTLIGYRGDDSGVELHTVGNQLYLLTEIEFCNLYLYYFELLFGSDMLLIKSNN